MKTRINGMITLASLILLSGCAGLKKNQEVDLSIYKNKIQKECIKQRSPEKQSKKKYSDDTISKLCRSKADRAINIDRDYFLLYNKDKMLANCKNKNKMLETKCLEQYQDKHYNKTVDDFIKERL
jgi:hypothetical protein